MILLPFRGRILNPVVILETELFFIVIALKTGLYQPLSNQGIEISYSVLSSEGLHVL
jgi:hypothetical protein